MPTAGDGSPLWGGVQFNYSEMQPMASAASWNTAGGIEANSVSQSMQFPVYHSSYLTQEEHDHYLEIKSDSLAEVVDDSQIDIDACVSGYQDNVDYTYVPVQQMALHNMGMVGAPPVPHETGMYLNSGSSTIPNHQASPDIGYSSPGPDYYGLYTQQQPQQSEVQSYVSPAYENQVVIENSGEVLIKEETVDNYVTDKGNTNYAKEIDSASEFRKEQKFKIIENVLICTDDEQQYEYQQRIQMMGAQVQQTPAQQQVFQIVPQQLAQPAQIQPRIPQAAPNQRIIVDDQQPSTSRAPLPAAVSAPAVVPIQHEAPRPDVIRNPPASPDPESPVPSDLSSFDGGQFSDGEDPANRRSARPSAITQSPWECTICGQFFARQCGLSQHKKWIHTPRNFCCEKCGKKFITQNELETHMLRHDSTDKPYKCDKCPKQFCHKNDLRRHTYRHSGAPFGCTLCERFFIRQDHLTSHMITHDKEKRKVLKERAQANKPKKQNK